MNNIAIIVPFRIQEGQNREWELSEFLPHMNEMMDSLKEVDNYHIYIIEQNQSRKKFNRGFLLNIGVALSDILYSTVILHDVDLLPQADIKEWYGFQPTKYPLHIAACWKQRYGYNKHYFGGIVSFNRSVFETINGFPNNFWGWGGEDDTLLDRCKINNVLPKKIREGTLKDIETNEKGETMDLDKKLRFLREHKDWKCNDRWERRDMDKWIWKTCGLQQISGLYEVVSTVTTKHITHTKVYI
jgi:hypothetical protein